jgi:hypothetical protein
VKSAVSMIAHGICVTDIATACVPHKRGFGNYNVFCNVQLHSTKMDKPCVQCETVQVRTQTEGGKKLSFRIL